jgi:hypothetical protein
MKRSNIAIFSIVASFWVIGIIAVSCNEERGPKAPDSKRLELDSTSMYLDQNYKVYTLEGCEYIVVGYSQLRWGSHKGNCKNPIHSKKSDTLSLQENYVPGPEKHFDCSIEEVIGGRKKPPYAYITECGIMFYDDVIYNEGDVLKGFVSPKHK